LCLSFGLAPTPWPATTHPAGHSDKESFVSINVMAWHASWSLYNVCLWFI